MDVEKYGKINIASSYITNRRVICSYRLWTPRSEVTDANAAGSKFRSFYIGERQQEPRARCDKQLARVW